MIDPTPLLSSVLQRVLEEAAFVFSEPGNVIPTSGERLRAELAFSGQERGRLVLHLPMDLGVEIAGNLLGTEASDRGARENAADAVGEIANMVSGALMAQLFGESGEYDLGTPVVQLVTEDGPETHAGASAFSVTFVTDDEQSIIATLVVDY